MHRAVYASDKPGLKLFMKARPQGLKQADHHGNTPLLLALKLGRTEMAWLMVRAGAELDVPSDGSFHLLVGRGGWVAVCLDDRIRSGWKEGIVWRGLVMSPIGSAIPVLVLGNAQCSTTRPRVTECAFLALYFCGHSPLRCPCLWSWGGVSWAGLTRAGGNKDPDLDDLVVRVYALPCLASDGSWIRWNGMWDNRPAVLKRVKKLTCMSALLALVLHSENELADAACRVLANYLRSSVDTIHYSWTG